MEWSFDPVGGVTGTLAMIAALLTAVWVAPVRFGGLTRSQRATLAGLRLGFVLLVLLSMLRPVIETTRSEKLRATLAVLIDSSRSMQVEDSLGGASRWRSGLEMLAEAEADLAGLAEDWDIVGYRFDSELAPAPFTEGRFALPAAAEGEQSALGAALSDLADRLSDQTVLGIVLISDGAQRAAPPRDQAPQLGMRKLAADGAPLFAVAVGSPGAGGDADLAMEDLAVSDTLFADAPAEVTGRLRTQGYANRRVRAQLLWEDPAGEMRVVDAQEIDINTSSQSYPVRLRHTPTTPGEQKVVLRVEPLEGEIVTGNNESGTFVSVREGGVRVLYLAGAQRQQGAPGIEQRFVRTALASSPDIALERIVCDYSGRRVLNVEDLPKNGYDVFLLDDIDKDALDLATWRTLATRVREGAGLMMLGGFHSFGPGGHRESPLADILPLEIGPAERQRFDERLRKDVHLAGPINLRPTSAGSRHPIVQLADPSSGARSADVWAKLPPLDGANRLDPALLKPNARVLLESVGGRPAPLLVEGQPGAGRALALAVDSTWRWVLAGSGDAHRRFWRQTVLWLAKKDGRPDRPVWIDLAARRTPRGATLAFEVRLAESEGSNAQTAPPDVQASVTTPEGKTLTIPLQRRGDRLTGVVRDTQAAGDYRVTAKAARDGATIGTAEARFLTPSTDLELDRPAADPALLGQLAAMTSGAGGRLLAPEELPGLLKELAAKKPDVREEVIARITLWDNWGVLLGMTGLLVTEWWLRKRWGLV